MGGLITAGAAFLILYFWLIGNHLAWLAVAAAGFWLAQMVLQTPADTTTDIILRGLVVLLLTGIPTIFWGKLAMFHRNNMGRKPPDGFIYYDLPPDDYNSHY